MKKTEADKDMIQKLYEESTIASKVMQEIIKKANVTVTDDEPKLSKSTNLSSQQRQQTARQEKKKT